MEDGGAEETVATEGMEEGAIGEVQGVVVISGQRMPIQATVAIH